MDELQLVIGFPGGWRVDAQFEGHTFLTDQPVKQGGEDAAPSPFIAFLASLGTCAGVYVLGFCRQRGIPTDGVRVVQRVFLHPQSGMAESMDLEIQLPPTFPEQYHAAVVRAVEQCKVKKHLESPPTIRTFARVVG